MLCFKWTYPLIKEGEWLGQRQSEEGDEVRTAAKSGNEKERTLASPRAVALLETIKSVGNMKSGTPQTSEAKVELTHT